MHSAHVSREVRDFLHYDDTQTHTDTHTDTHRHTDTHTHTHKHDSTHTHTHTRTVDTEWITLEVRLRVIHTWGHIIEHTQSLHLGVRSQIVQSLHLGVRSHPRWS
jgi:hypothetical protein